MQSPRVTVFMPVWNGARYLDESVESILGQSLRDLELIAVDDASTDETPALLARWAAADDRVRVLRNQVNLGAAGAANVALRAARGRFLARQDADDVSLPDRLALEAAALEADPALAAVSMNFEFMDERGVALRVERRDHPPEIVAYLTLFTNALGGASQVMFRRDAVLAAGGYDESLVTGEDAELYARLVERGRIAVLPRVGMRYRLHGAQLSSRTLPAAVEQRKRSLAAVRIARHLGREVTPQEVLALLAAWSGSLAGLDPAAAARLMDESFARFQAAHPGQPQLHARLRRLIASRLGASAAVVFRAGHLRAALQYLKAAISWNPLLALSEPPRLLFSSARMRLRRLSG